MRARSWRCASNPWQLCCCWPAAAPRARAIDVVRQAALEALRLDPDRRFARVARRRGLRLQEGLLLAADD